MPRWTETWLHGPPASIADRPKWPGERLGLPQDGVGASAGGGRRLVGYLLDIAAANLITLLFFTWPYTQTAAQLTLAAAWCVLAVPSVAFFGFTPGMAAVGIRVARLDGATMVGLWRAAVRWLLTVPLIPPIVRNADGRGWHDRATDTVVVRMR